MRLSIYIHCLTRRFTTRLRWRWCPS